MNKSLDDTFKKYHVVVHCDSSLPLMARKIFNVLISFDDSIYGNNEVQRVSEEEVLQRLGKSRKHIAYYREQFLLLGKSNFTFFGYDENNKRIYGTCSILSGAIIDEGSQEWIFSTPTKIMEWIRHRNEQITLSLSIQHALNSKYSLALYETLLCKLHENDHTLVPLTPEEIRFITCGEDKHKEYKYLKKQVIKPAIEELSNNSNLWVEIDSESRKNRKVQYVNFAVKKKDGTEHCMELRQKMNQVYGIDLGMVNKMLADYSLEQIENGLAYTRQKLEEGAIVALNGRKSPNIAGFAVNAIRKKMTPSRTEILALTDQKPRVKTESKEAMAAHPALTEERMENFIQQHPELNKTYQQQFLDQSDGVIQALAESEGFSNPIVDYQYRKYLYAKKLPPIKSI